KINVLVLAAATGTRLRVAISERNNPLRQRASPLWNMATALLVARADIVVAQTRRAAEHVPPLARGRTTVIPNPVDMPCRHAGRNDMSPERRLVAVGRLTGQKGFDLLVEAFARVADRHPRWSLGIWGEGGERAALTELIDRLGMAGRVTLH